MPEYIQQPENNPFVESGEAVRSCADSWQKVFDNLTDFSQFEALRQKASLELNSLNPFQNKQVYIYGDGRQHQFNIQTFTATADVWGPIEPTGGTHCGYKVILHEWDNGALSYQVMQEVKIGEFDSNSMLDQNIRHHVDIYNYYSLDSSCMSIDAIDDIYYAPENDMDLKQLLEGAFHSSRRFKKIVRSNEFRQLNQIEQTKKVEQYLLRTEQAFNLRGLDFTLMAEYGYAYETGKFAPIKPYDMSNVVIGGICLGLESLENLALHEQSPRLSAKIFRHLGGLSLALDPNAETQEGLHLAPEIVVFIPVDQNMDIEAA